MATLRMVLAWPVLAAVLIFVIWQFLKWIARVQARKEKIKFNHDFALLKMCVVCSDVNEHIFKKIAELFNDIENNSMKNDELLEKLRNDFEYKFREFFEEKPVNPILK